MRSLFLVTDLVVSFACPVHVKRPGTIGPAFKCWLLPTAPTYYSWVGSFSFLRSVLSTEYFAKIMNISSQLCSPQYTSLSGDGL